MHMMYFTEQPMAAYDSKAGLDYGATALTFQSAQITAKTMASDTIGWQQSGGNIFLYVNTSNKIESLTSADMKIELLGEIFLRS